MAQELNPVLGNMANDPKATEDFSKDAEEVIERVDTMKQAGRVEEAVEEMLALEKKCRQACDGRSTSKLLCKICQTYFDVKDWSKLKEHIVLLSKKRGQLKRATTDMVHLVMSWLDGLDKETKLELIGTLNEVTEGKIFVEVEKARSARKNRVHIEPDAVGAPEKDYIRTQIISKKLNPKLLEADDFQDLKILYYEYMVKYWLHEKKFLDASKAYLSIFKTASVQADESKWKPVLTAHALFLTLAQYDNEQEDMLNKLDTLEAKKLDKVPVFQQVVKLFLRKEITAWPLANEAEVRSHPVFQDESHEGGAARWDMLKKRVVQHNIKVISEYYEQIHTARLCELLCLSDKEAETELSELVCSKFVYAKIDRPAGTIKFGKKQTYTDRLNDWSGSITKMLDLVENT
eukprot:CAMPEP_0177564712 /NCGR_PEP_ID=MMETSP0369-20130122/73759_1 /TAXON_ID=447022 ORGANISM="Scrippsiella hangoei-like, Strain SHHI-4" /NCGR_SAMPLE_ID=MMETSP0369 /ASSEMBLY_ACC=CAM_ASM_000364 /LENGTH=403 /DNA_ID=CAMNT_0019052013 /DNA_START=1 /DNA_END=1209 /DNA_ORIENTATION=-